MEEFTVNCHAFKVICQKCGKTGITDFHIPSGQNDFQLKFSAYSFDGENMEEYEYYLCSECQEEERFLE